MLVAIYIAIKYNITIAIMFAVFAYFFRDFEHEKESSIEFFSRSKIFHASKIYMAITSFVAFVFVTYKITNGEYELLVSNGYSMLYIILLIIFFPFILLALLHELYLFKTYK